jgi:transposase-like protein
MIERMTGTAGTSAQKLSNETGVAQGTLSKWLREARSFGAVPGHKGPSRPVSVEDKIRILSHAAKLTLADIEQWRLALGQPEGRASAANRQIRTLERELARKDKALAEAAALLILKKKIEERLGEEDDDTDEENDK